MILKSTALRTTMLMLKMMMIMMIMMIMMVMMMTMILPDNDHDKYNHDHSQGSMNLMIKKNYDTDKSNTPIATGVVKKTL